MLGPNLTAQQLLLIASAAIWVSRSLWFEIMLVFWYHGLVCGSGINKKKKNNRTKLFIIYLLKTENICFNTSFFIFAVLNLELLSRQIMCTEMFTLNYQQRAKVTWASSFICWTKTKSVFFSCVRVFFSDII